MLTAGHIATSYLIAQSAKALGIELTGSEVVGIIIAGNIIDVDFFAGFFTGKTGEAHHHNITHTPIGVLMVWLVGLFLFQMSFVYATLVLATMMMHLVLDDVGYWAYRMKLYKSRVNPQINWLYPYKKFYKHDMMKDNRKVMKFYLVNTWPIAVSEVILVVIAVIVLLVSP